MHKVTEGLDHGTEFGRLCGLLQGWGRESINFSEVAYHNLGNSGDFYRQQTEV
jgi:hypothetical protein